MNVINQYNTLSAGQIGPIEIIDDSIYTAEAIAPTGETMYLAMEPLGDDKEKWENYKSNITLLVTGGRYCPGGEFTIGSLTEIGSRINDKIALKKFLETRSIPEYWTLNPERFKQLCTNLKKREIKDNSQKAQELSMIPYASCGMNVNRQTHVVYVSKSPVTGRIKFAAEPLCFSGLVDMYGDLIMSVGVTVRDLVENRGIFRNPLSVVEGGYGGISMMIHCFTCMVIQNNYPNVETFRVRPFKKMGELFLNSFPKHLVTVGGISGDLYNGGFEHEQDVRVSVKVLADLNRAK